MAVHWQKVTTLNLTLTDAVAAATGSEISLIFSTSGGTLLTDAVSTASGSEVSMIAVS